MVCSKSYRKKNFRRSRRGRKRVTRRHVGGRKRKRRATRRYVGGRKRKRRATRKYVGGRKRKRRLRQKGGSWSWNSPWNKTEKKAVDPKYAQEDEASRALQKKQAQLKKQSGFKVTKEAIDNLEKKINDLKDWYEYDEYAPNNLKWYESGTARGKYWQPSGGGQNLDAHTLLKNNDEKIADIERDWEEIQTKKNLYKANNRAKAYWEKGTHSWIGEQWEKMNAIDEQERQNKKYVDELEYEGELG